MKVKVIKKLVPFILFLGLVASLSSCNRGMGCPSFSVGDVVETLADCIPSPIVKD